jgi:signal peptidase I
MWVMGDHRLVSQDSRCSGQVPIANVIGKAFVIVWPNARWDTLGTPATFRDVPAPSSAGPARHTGVHAGAGRPGQFATVDASTAVVLPILASLVVPARTRLFRTNRRRRLRP